MKISNFKFNGFTLIELLVAITIVAILSIIGLTIYQDTIKNAKDTKIKQDIDAISSALEQHYNPISSRYQVIPADEVEQRKWFSNGVPKTPAGGDYLCLPAPPSTPAPSFKICAYLSDGNLYCKRSGFGEEAECP